jgi:hypothetical protein
MFASYIQVNIYQGDPEGKSRESQFTNHSSTIMKTMNTHKHYQFIAHII